MRGPRPRPRLSQEIELIVSAEATQRLDLLDDLAGEVKRRAALGAEFWRGARACLACAPCTKPKFRAKKGWCAEISCARCRVLEECQRVGVVLVEESVAGFCAKDDRRFSGLVDTGFVADYNEALRVLVLRLEEDELDGGDAPPWWLRGRGAGGAGVARRGGDLGDGGAAGRASCLSFCLLFILRCRRRALAARSSCLPGLPQREASAADETGRWDLPSVISASASALSRRALYAACCSNTERRRRTSEGFRTRLVTSRKTLPYCAPARRRCGAATLAEITGRL